MHKNKYDDSSTSIYERIIRRFFVKLNLLNIWHMCHYSAIQIG